MRKFLIAFVLISAAANAQVFFTAAKQTSLTATAEVVTIQQSTTGAKTVNFSGAYFDCSVACTVTLERSGSLATSTTLAIKELNHEGATSTLTAWSSSNSSGGNVIGNYNCGGECHMSIDLSKIVFTRANTNDNLTIRSSAITGTFSVVFLWSER